MKHKIEEVARVYLLWDDATGEWVIDPICMDGSSLDGSTDGVVINCGDHEDHEDVDNDVCEQEAVRAGLTNLPNARELLHMLADEFGYGVLLDGRQASDRKFGPGGGGEDGR